MLGKLIKQELKESSKLMLLSHGFLIIFSIISGVLIQLAISTKFLESDAWVPQTIFVLFIVLNILLLIISSLAVMFYIAVRFYKNFFTDQGYLMFTLPTTASQLLHSKFISALVWFIFNGLICSICVGIIALPLIPLVSWDTIWTTLMQGLQVIPTKLTIAFVVLTITGTLYAVLYTYACICLGQLFNKSRILLSVVFYGVGLMIIQFIIGIFYIVSMFNQMSMYSETYFETMDDAQAVTLQLDLMYNSYLYTTLIMAAITIVSYFVCRYIMRKKLNLL